jgi:hypothetical protein
MEGPIIRHDEAARTASMHGADSLAHRSKASGAPLQACLRVDQAFFVFNAAHARTSIKSPDGKAWIRPLAFCPTLVAAKERGREVHEADKGQEIRVQPAGKVFLLGAERYNDAIGADGGTILDMSTREREQAKANALVDAAELLGKTKIETVQRRAEERRAGTLDMTRTTPEKGAAPAAEPPTDSGNEVSIKEIAPSAAIISDVPVSAERRAQRYAVLAVVNDAMAEAETAKRRQVWWRARCGALRVAWCKRLGVSLHWQQTLAEWLATHPIPDAGGQWINEPLFVSPSMPEAVQEWARERDAALLDAEWKLHGGEGAHDFDYTFRVGHASLDSPPAATVEEPAIISIGACETLEDAQRLAETAGKSPELFHVDVFVCSMYEWGCMERRHSVKSQKRALDEIVPIAHGGGDN